MPRSGELQEADVHLGHGELGGAVLCWDCRMGTLPSPTYL